MNEREAQPDADFERAQTASGLPSNELSLGDDDNHAGIVTAYSRRARRAMEQSPPEPALPEEPTETPARGYRVRDFRPQAGTKPRSASPATALAPDGHRRSEPGQPTRQFPQWTPPRADNDGDLPYFTQAGPLSPPPQPPPTLVTPPLVNSVPPELAAPSRPLTRRQLRELETSQGNRPEADDVPSTPAAQVPSLVTETGTPLQPEPVLPPVVRLAPSISVPPPAEPTSRAQAPASPIVSPEPVVFTEPVDPPELVVLGETKPNPPDTSVAVPPAPGQATGVAGPRGVDRAPDVYGAPLAQWSASDAGQLPANPRSVDGHQPGASFIRSVGVHPGDLTTSALVMPSVPQASDIIQPFSSTGEILVTGTINLPSTLGTTGAHPARFDHSDIDALFAAEDQDFAPADSAPVRAIRAVSTHTSPHGVISAKKPASNRLPMMMAVTAGILAVGVAALFAAGMIFGYF